MKDFLDDVPIFRVGDVAISLPFTLEYYHEISSPRELTMQAKTENLVSEGSWCRGG